MTEVEFLLLVRGPLLAIATAIFVIGILIRFAEIFALGRKANLAEPRGSEMAGGWRTIVSRFIPDSGTLKRSTFIVVAGYIFHFGLFVAIFLYTPHILVFREVFGLSWPALPSPVVDAVTVVSMLALVAVLGYRLWDPVRRFLSRFDDYLIWLVTLLPLLTGYMAFHRLGFSPGYLLAAHILSVELLMVVFPFTKLMHAFTIFLARWYNGATAGYRGIQS